MIGHCRRILEQYDSRRVLAVDAFRGLAIAAMVLVNNPGSWLYVYAPLKHATWHGWTPTDLIFPFFIFAVGISVALSLSKYQSDSTTVSKWALVLKALKRTLVIFVLGLFLALFFYDFQSSDFSWVESQLYDVRIMGVLQRIALVYFACFLLYLLFSVSQLIGMITILLLTYTLMLLLIPYDVDGQATVGQLLKGNNFTAWIDWKILRPNHIHDPRTIPFGVEPEGLLSTISAIASGLIGVTVGHWLVNKKQESSELKKIFLTAVFLLVFGFALSLLHPINKSLWSASFVLLSSGFACLLLCILLYTTEIKRWHTWCSPLLVFGVNSLLLFVLSGVFARLSIMTYIDDMPLKSWIYSQILQPQFGNYAGSFFYSVALLFMFYWLFYALYRRRLIWKL